MRSKLKVLHLHWQFDLEDFDSSDDDLLWCQFLGDCIKKLDRFKKKFCFEKWSSFLMSFIAKNMLIPVVNFTNILWSAFVPISLCQKITRQAYKRSKKAACKMLVKLTAGVNFINALCASFTCADRESIKTQSSCQYRFALLGSACIKAA